MISTGQKPPSSGQIPPQKAQKMKIQILKYLHLHKMTKIALLLIKIAIKNDPTGLSRDIKWSKSSIKTSKPLRHDWNTHKILKNLHLHKMTEIASPSLNVQKSYKKLPNRPITWRQTAKKFHQPIEYRYKVLKSTHHQIPSSNARMDRVDRNWTKSGGRLFSQWLGALLVDELAQVSHYTEEWVSVCLSPLSPPHLNPRDQSGRVDILTRPYTTAACAAGVVTGTAGRDSSRCRYNENRRIRQIVLDCDWNRVKTTYEKTCRKTGGTARSVHVSHPSED